MSVGLAGAQIRTAAWTRRLIGEPLLAIAARWHDSRHPSTGDPRSVFVLRNNDLGDVLIITPLFEALRRRFPSARLVAGVGQWSVDLLKGNPHLSDVMVVDAPWFNKVVRPQGLMAEVAFLSGAPAVTQLRAQRFDVGIDVLGSVPGAALLLRAAIPHRLGVRGYAGGHASAHQSVTFNPHEHVGRSALRFAELLGLPSAELPENRPQVFLTDEERAAGSRHWTTTPRARTRIVVGPGTGDPSKGWPREHFAAAVSMLSAMPDVDIVVVGGAGDCEIGEALAAAGRGVTNLAGRCGVRETFGLLASADAVLTNPSMLMHAAAAFRLPTVVVLGPAFASARQHDQQWGYPGTCRSLGYEPGESNALATPDQAISCLMALRG